MATPKSVLASHIAVVDDDFRILESLGSLLESAGYTAAVFHSAEAFLQSDAIAKASCLITDVRMPDVDGLELQRRVKSRRPELPVICITAHDDDTVKKRALHEGAASFLHKPFSRSELLKTIREVLQKTEDQDVDRGKKGGAE